MASPTPSADEVYQLTAHARSVVALSDTVRGRYRRRSHPSDPARREALADAHGRLVTVAEDLRRERIRAARDSEFAAAYGVILANASRQVRKERYSVYRMLNPGGTLWTPSA